MYYDLTVRTCVEMGVCGAGEIVDGRLELLIALSLQQLLLHHAVLCGQIKRQQHLKVLRQ